MTIKTTRHLRTLRRYQFMFRTSVGAGALGAVLTAIGASAWIVGPLPIYLPWGMLMLAASGALVLKVVSSTARILESEGCFTKRASESLDEKQAISR